MGLLTITADGQWNYEIANDVVQYLDEGENVSEVFQVETTDGTTQEITITINSANEPPGTDSLTINGQDKLYGGNGRDTLNGGGDDDQLFGDSGNDIISGQ